MKRLIYRDLRVESFETVEQFYEWLREYHICEQPFWLRLYKKNSNKKTIAYTDAVDVLLCWGWIDGLLNKYNNESYVIRISPRRAKSVWSKVNVEKVERLEEEGKMQPSGAAKVEAAKKDGRWEASYGGAGSIDVSDSFKLLLEENIAAKTFYDSLSKAEKYSFAFRIATAVGLEKRKAVELKLIQRLSDNKKF